MKNKLIPWNEGTEAHRYELGITMAELTAFMVENNIPPHARIQYVGCGSHAIEFVWVVEEEGLLC